jgi:hypothetical protein
VGAGILSPLGCRCRVVPSALDNLVANAIRYSLQAAR